MKYIVYREITFTKLREWLLVGLVVGGLSIWLMRPFFHPWFPLVSDGGYYLSRMVNYNLAFNQGQVPPRWAPNFKFGLGYPVFNYNYPLPNILGTVAIRSGMETTEAMKLLLAMGLWAGGVGMYGWLRRSGRSKLAAITGAGLFILAPFQMYDALHRGTIGEFLALNYLPWLWWRVDQVAKNQAKSKLVTGLMLLGFVIAHNIVVILTVGVLCLWVIANYSREEIKRLLVWLVITGLLGAFFWLPAITEMGFAQISQAPINNQYWVNFRSWSEILGVKTILNYGQDHIYEAMRQLGYGAMAAVVGSLALVMRFKKSSRNVWLWMGIFLGSTVMMTRGSQWIWQIIPGLRFIQHPIRFMVVGVFSSSVLAGWLVDRYKPKMTAIVVVALAILNHLLVSPQVQGYVPYPDEFLINYPLTSAAADEFDPIWYDRSKTADFAAGGDEHFVNLPGDTKVEIDNWNGSRRSYDLILASQAVIIEKTLYFPGWETSIDGQKIDLWRHRADQWGLINFPVGAGRHKIETRFTQNTWPRIVGNGLTVIGFVVIVGWEITSRVKIRNPKFKIRNKSK